MNFVTIGIFTPNLQGIEGATLLMLSHGIISSALFISIGVIYDRFHTRLLPYYGGLTTIMPLYSFFFLFFTFSNISFPGTASFIGELLILLGIYQQNIIVAFLASTGIILGAVYSIWLANRILFSTTSPYIHTNEYIDITRKEFAILMPLFISTLIFGIYPSFILDTLYSASALILNRNANC